MSDLYLPKELYPYEAILNTKNAFQQIIKQMDIKTKLSICIDLLRIYIVNDVIFKLHHCNIEWIIITHSKMTYPNLFCLFHRNMGNLLKSIFGEQGIVNFYFLL